MYRPDACRCSSTIFVTAQWHLDRRPDQYRIPRDHPHRRRDQRASPRTTGGDDTSRLTRALARRPWRMAGMVQRYGPRSRGEVRLPRLTTDHWGRTSTGPLCPVLIETLTRGSSCRQAVEERASSRRRSPGTASAIRSSPRRSILHYVPAANPPWPTGPRRLEGRLPLPGVPHVPRRHALRIRPTRLLPQIASLVPGLGFRLPKCRLQTVTCCEAPKDGRYERPTLGITHEPVGTEHFDVRVRGVHRADELVRTPKHMSSSN